MDSVKPSRIGTVEKAGFMILRMEPTGEGGGNKASADKRKLDRHRGLSLRKPRVSKRTRRGLGQPERSDRQCASRRRYLDRHRGRGVLRRGGAGAVAGGWFRQGIGCQSDRETLDHVWGPRPVLARDESDQFPQDPSERFFRGGFVQGPGVLDRNQGPQIRQESGICEFREHSLLRLGAGNAHPRGFQVEYETFHDPLPVQPLECAQSMMEIEQVASLASLEERPEFRRKDFFRRERRNVSRPAEPGVFYCERNGDRRIERIGLPCIDFDLQANRSAGGRVFRVDPKRSLGAVALGAKLARPSQGSRAARMASRTGPIGPVPVLTRSMSSE